MTVAEDSATDGLRRQKDEKAKMGRAERMEREVEEAASPLATSSTVR